MYAGNFALREICKATKPDWTKPIDICSGKSSSGKVLNKSEKRRNTGHQIIN